MMVGSSSVDGVQRECDMSQQGSSEGELRVALEPQAQLTNCSIELSPRLATSMPLSAPVAPDAPGLLLREQASDHSNRLPCTANGTHASDCYSWRKYGKKQMKSSNTSTNYYRCADPKCSAKKKVQQCDNSGHVVDVMYVGCHNHEPLLMKCNRSKGHSSQHLQQSGQQSSSSSNCNVGIKVEDRNADGIVSKEFLCSSPMGTQENNPHKIAATKVPERHIDATRLENPEKERGGLHPDSVLRAINEPNIVIYAASDSGNSCDGYKWRKYGQKMVKGNSHFRSYYRCTSSGCPARKHVERSTDNAVSSVVTYCGKHNHDVPKLVIRKRHEPKSSVVHSPTAIPDNDDRKKPKTSSCQKPSTAEEEVDLMGEKILELGGEQALESAQALLSIGRLT